MAVSAQGEFAVTLSALAQEYLTTITSSTETQEAADVALILDISTSMGGTGLRRVENMTNAANIAIDLIMDANPKNRIGVYYFSAPTNTGALMPLASYRAVGSDESGPNAPTGAPSPNLPVQTVEITDSAAKPTGRYLTYFGNVDKGRKVAARNTLMRTDLGGEETAWTSPDGIAEQISGTATQMGLYTAISAMKSDISTRGTKAADEVERYPYVLLFTDGEANKAYTNWHAAPPSGSDISGTKAITAATILAAAKLKDELNQAYETYNGKARETIWFNVGLGIQEGDTFGSALLSPYTVTASAGANKASVFDEIASRVGSYSAQYGPGGNPGFVFTDENKYIYYASDTDLAPLNQAFEDLGELVKHATKKKTMPISSTSSGGGEATVVFSDELGVGMRLKEAPKLGTTSPTAAVTGSVTTYTYPGGVTAEYSTNTNTLTWNIPADQLPLYTFKNIENPTEGYDAVEPIRLHYTVIPADDFDGTTPAYSNKNATAVFTPTKDNPYYYNIVLNETGGFKSSSTKPLVQSVTDPASQLVSTIAKADNPTGTVAAAQAYAWDAEEDFRVTLGNNGKLTPLLSITKSAGVATIEKGTDVTYSIQVSNHGNEDLSNVKVEINLPTGLSFVPGSLTVDGVSTPDVFPYIISNLPAKTTVELGYKANPNASGTLTSEARITEVDGDSIPKPPKAEVGLNVFTPQQFTPVIKLTLNDMDGDEDADDYPFTDSGKTVTLVPNGGGAPIVLAEAAAKPGTCATNADVPAGKYDVYIDGEKIAGITLSSKNKQARVDYFTVTFHDPEVPYGSSTPQKMQFIRSGEKAVQPTNPSKSGFTFQGWKSTRGGNTPFDFNSVITAPADVYASWTKTTSSGSGSGGTIFDTNGGSPVLSGFVWRNGVLIPPSPPTRSGYAFTGWFLDPQATIPWDGKTIPTRLYAGWISLNIPKTGDQPILWLGLGLVLAAIVIGIYGSKKKSKQ